MQGASFSNINNFKTFIGKFQHAPGTARLQDVFCCKPQCQPAAAGSAATKACSQCKTCPAEFYSPATQVCKTCVSDNNREKRKLAAQAQFEQTHKVASIQKKFLTTEQTVEFNKKRKTMREVLDDRLVKRRALQARLAEELGNSTNIDRAKEREVVSKWSDADRKRIESYWNEVAGAAARYSVYKQDPAYISRQAANDKKRQLRTASMLQELKKHGFNISDYIDYVELQRWLLLDSHELMDVLKKAGVTSGAIELIRADPRAFRRVVSQREYLTRPPGTITQDEMIARAEALAAIKGDETQESIDEFEQSIQLAYECSTNAERIRRLQRLDDECVKRRAAYEKARHLANPHRRDEYLKSETYFRTARDPKRMMKTLLMNATARGHCVEIDCEDLDRIASQPCQYCGELRKNGASYHTDRVDNNVGYTRDNCVPCCTRCNMMKKNLSVNAFLFRAFNVVYGFGRHDFEYPNRGENSRWDYNASGGYDKYEKNAQKSGLEFEITREQFNAMAVSNCYYCCKPASSNSGSLGLDRADSALPYVINNVVPCCAPCNFMKREMSVSDFKKHCELIVSRFELQEN